MSARLRFCAEFDGYTFSVYANKTEDKVAEMKEKAQQIIQSGASDDVIFKQLCDIADHVIKTGEKEILAEMRLGGKRYNLGWYLTRQDAESAYDIAKEIYDAKGYLSKEDVIQIREAGHTGSRLRSDSRPWTRRQITNLIFLEGRRYYLYRPYVHGIAHHAGNYLTFPSAERAVEAIRLAWTPDMSNEDAIELLERNRIESDIRFNANVQTILDDIERFDGRVLCVADSPKACREISKISPGADTILTEDTLNVPIDMLLAYPVIVAYGSTWCKMADLSQYDVNAYQLRRNDAARKALTQKKGGGTL